MSDTFLLGHLTDLHLGPLPRIAMHEFNLKRALGIANWVRKRRFYHQRAAFECMLAAIKAAKPDHIAVTGDLCNIGLPAEHRRALATLAEIGPEAQVSVVAGNHDIYCPLYPDADISLWATYTASEAVEGKSEWFQYPYLRRRGRIALIGVNSAVPTPPGIAQGEVGATNRRLLEGILSATGAEGLARVVMIHHPPLVGQAPAARALRDAAQLTELLVKTGVELVIHGHNHLDEWNEIDTSAGRAVVVGVGSASMVRPRHAEPAARAALYAISHEPGGWRLDVTRLGLGADGTTVSTVERRDVHLERASLVPPAVVPLARR